MLNETTCELIVISNDQTNQEKFRQYNSDDKINFEISNIFLDTFLESYDGFIFDGLASFPESLIKHMDYNSYALIATKEEMIKLLNKYPNCSEYFVWIDSSGENIVGYQIHQFTSHLMKNKKSNIYEIFLNTLIDSVPDLVWFKDLKGSHLKINDAFCKAVGKTKEQCENRGHYYIWDIEPDEYADGEYVCLETEQEVIKRKETCLFDEKVLSKNGLRQFKTYKSPLFDKKNRMLGTVGIAKDVTDLQNIGRELEVILESIPLATLVVDHLGECVYSNIKFSEYFKLSTEDLAKTTYDKFCKNSLGISSKELESTTLKEVTLNQNNQTKVYRIQQQSIADIFGNHFGHFFIALDITKESQLQDEIVESANTDFLTGLYNRRYLYETITKRIKEKPLCVVYFDLDKFKSVNDNFGHREGDRALILMASLLRDYFKDTVVSRVGGDEFVVSYFDGFDYERVQEDVEKFIAYINEEFDKDDHFKSLSSCAGITYNTNLDAKTDDLISHADYALYEAKSKGKSQWSVYKE